MIDCRTSTEWCRSYTCEATVGTVIAVPCCGNVNQSVTYINQTDIIAANVTGCLNLNLTIYDNQINIRCQESCSYFIIAKCKSGHNTIE